MVVQSASLVRAAAPRSRALSLANTCSIGFRSGEQIVSPRVVYQRRGWAVLSCLPGSKSWQADEGIIAERRDGFQRHVASALNRPFIMLQLSPYCSWKADVDGRRRLRLERSISVASFGSRGRPGRRSSRHCLRAAPESRPGAECRLGPVLGRCDVGSCMHRPARRLAASSIHAWAVELFGLWCGSGSQAP